MSRSSKSKSYEPSAAAFAFTKRSSQTWCVRWKASRPTATRALSSRRFTAAVSVLMDRSCARWWSNESWRSATQSTPRVLRMGPSTAVSTSFVSISGEAGMDMPLCVS